MAGIGFELRRSLRRDGLFGLARAYGLAGVVSSGPWVLSILGVLFIGLSSADLVRPPEQVTQFQVTVTWLMATSLLVTGPLQLMFSRFVADRHYGHEEEAIAPNLLGALLATTLLAGGGGGLAAWVLFGGESLGYRVLFAAGLATACDIWVAVVLLSGLKAFRAVLGLFAVGYLASAGTAVLLAPWGLVGLLLGFVLGQQLLLLLMVGLALRAYPSRRLIAFDFLRRAPEFVALGLTGLFLNLGVWADKLVFWLNPGTSNAVIGPLRASPLYDLPIFLAYLSIIPGMAVFLLHVETDFAEAYQTFFARVREGSPLTDLAQVKRRMILSVQRGLYGICKVQGLVVLFVLLWGRELLDAAGISPLHAHLLFVDAVGVGLQVLLLATLNVLFYLDQRRSVLALSVGFAAVNGVLTMLTQQWGARFYGYGFAVAGLGASLVGLVVLSRKLERLEMETFMLQCDG